MRYLFYFFAFSLLLCSLNKTNAQWTNVKEPYIEYTTCFANIDKNLFAGTGIGVYVSINYGINWSLTSLKNCWVYSLATIDGILLAGTDKGIFSSSNNGVNWVNLNNEIIGKQALTFAVIGTNLFVGTYTNGVFISTDNGTNWAATNSGLTEPWVNSLAVIGTNLFAGTNSGVFLSTNNGTNWSDISPKFGWNEIKHLAVVDKNLFAGTNLGGVFQSTNNGNSWIEVNNGISYVPKNGKTVSAFTVFGTNLFVGIYGGGVYLTTNNGINWTEINNGLTVTLIHSLTTCGSNLIAGTIGSGVWWRPLDQIISSVERHLPMEYNLEQNYPNPFNPSTTINYYIPKTSFVTIKVYDALGKEVATLVNQEKTLGKYKAEFNSVNLSSGIYFYRIKAGDFVDTKKLVLIK